MLREKVTNLDGLGFESGQEQEIFLFSKTVQTGSWANPASCSVGTGVVSREVKQPGREIDRG
jgi:hypothetical protein